EHIDAVADPAALHEQRRALSAESARDQADAFLLRRKHDIRDFGIGLAELDQRAQAGIWHVADLTNTGAPKIRIDDVRPIQRASFQQVQLMLPALQIVT